MDSYKCDECGNTRTFRFDNDGVVRCHPCGSTVIQESRVRGSGIVVQDDSTLAAARRLADHNANLLDHADQLPNDIKTDAGFTTVWRVINDIRNALRDFRAADGGGDD